MFVYLVSVRVFPMTPNWLLNITAPLLDVPLSLFFLSVLIGEECSLVELCGEVMLQFWECDNWVMNNRWCVKLCSDMLKTSLTHHPRVKQHPVYRIYCMHSTGLVPYNLVCVQAGEVLSEVRSLDDVLTPRRLLALLTLALAVLTLSHFTQKAKNRHSD